MAKILDFKTGAVLADLPVSRKPDPIDPQPVAAVADQSKLIDSINSVVSAVVRGRVNYDDDSEFMIV